MCVCAGTALDTWILEMRLKIMGARSARPKELMLVFPSRLLFRVGRGEGSDCARALQAEQ